MIFAWFIMFFGPGWLILRFDKLFIDTVNLISFFWLHLLCKIELNGGIIEVTLILCLGSTLEQICLHVIWLEINISTSAYFMCMFDLQMLCIIFFFIDKSLMICLTACLLAYSCSVWCRISMFTFNRASFQAVFGRKRNIDTINNITLMFSHLSWIVIAWWGVLWSHFILIFARKPACIIRTYRTNAIG